MNKTNAVLARSTKRPVRRFFTGARGANLVEYMILVGAVALVSLGAAKLFQGKVKEQMDKEGTAVSQIPTQ